MKEHITDLFKSELTTALHTRIAQMIRAGNIEVGKYNQFCGFPLYALNQSGKSFLIDLALTLEP